jgi:small-conductance mechanosensitive channel/CRP-like cAMP-binding protein
VSAGVVALAATLGFLVVIRSRFLRGRLRFSAYLLLVFLALEVATTQQVGEVQLIASIARLLLVLAVVNLLVALLVNPWSEHRASDRFPAIAQEVAVIGLFTVVATVLMRDQLLTTSAVGAVIVGFALQDTLGNLFAGLAIQIEKPFRVGHWISVADREGQVAEITWRATKLRTEAGQFLIVPNSIIAKDPILNYSEPSIPTRLEVEVGVAYQSAPTVVKAALREAIDHAPLVLKQPPADIILKDFGGSSIVYKVRFWIEDYEQNEPARDQLRSAIWYVFARRGIEIPYPIQVEISREEQLTRLPSAISAAAEKLGRTELFSELSADERYALAAACPEQTFADGEPIVRQDDAGSSMFVVTSGAVRVVLEPSGREVATIGAEGFFGEMSMLTGAARTATVRAAGDVVVVEVPAERFRELVVERPAILDHVTSIVTTRRAGLEEAKMAAAAATPSPAATHRSLLERIQQFLRLT